MTLKYSVKFLMKSAGKYYRTILIHYKNSRQEKKEYNIHKRSIFPSCNHTGTIKKKKINTNLLLFDKLYDSSF